MYLRIEQIEDGTIFLCAIKKFKLDAGTIYHISNLNADQATRIRGNGKSERLLSAHRFLGGKFQTKIPFYFRLDSLVEVEDPTC